MGYIDYFLIVQDYINYAKSVGIVLQDVQIYQIIVKYQIVGNKNNKY